MPDTTPESMRQRNKEISGGRPVPRLSAALRHGVAISLSSFFSYWATTRLLGSARLISRDDELLGGMWAVAATVFVHRVSYESSTGAALSRMAATGLSFALCLGYLLFFSFHSWGLALLIGAGTIVLTLLGRPEDVITTSITTTVVMVVAAISPEHGWREPVLRLLDTIVGTVVGTLAAKLEEAWLALSVRRTTAEAAEPPR